MAAHYDDPKFSYTDYWQGRDYEHQSEILALNHLLTGTKFSRATDLGGGFGRLSPTIAAFSRKVNLIEPSNKLRSQAKKNLSTDKSITILPGTAQHTHLPTASQDLVVMVRVAHHLPDPLPALLEIRRVLKPHGLLILEFANSHHFKAQIQSWLTGQPILPIAIEKRSPINIKRQTIPFVNHSPQTIFKLLAKAGFQIQKTLSVSNFRSPLLKQILPTSLLLKLENLAQLPLSHLNFGPSIFILAKLKNP